MKSKLIVLMVGALLCIGATQAIPASAKSACEWIELGEVGMSSFFDESWHWTTATLYKLENTNLAYRVRYEDKYYTIIARMENGEIKCSVLIPYQGEKRWFSFIIPCG